MPDIFDVANHFNAVAVYDGYTGSFLFNGQFSNFMEAGPEGSISRRRTMSTAPSTTLPTRSVILVAGERWVIGNENLDTMCSAVIRQNHWLKKVTEQVALLSPGEAALGAAGMSVYVSKDYLKDTVEAITDATYDSFWNIYLSSAEIVAKGYFMRSGSRLFRVRGIHEDTSGHQNAACDELNTGAYVTVNLAVTHAYDPVADAYVPVAGPTSGITNWGDYFLDPVTGGVVLSATGILLERSKVYTKKTEADSANMPGDKSLLLAMSAVTPIVGKIIQIDHVDWRVLNFTAELDAWVLHIRRA